MDKITDKTSILERFGSETLCPKDVSLCLSLSHAYLASHKKHLLTNKSFTTLPVLRTKLSSAQNNYVKLRPLLLTSLPLGPSRSLAQRTA